MRCSRIIIFAFFLIFLTISVDAYLGVSPPRYVINFEPGLKQEFSFTFSTDDPNIIFEIHIEGDLAEYVTLNKKTLSGIDTVVATVQLPEKIETPGNHIIRIGALQRTNESGATIGLVGNVNGQIIVDVPFPGKYAEMDFSIGHAKAGEEIPYNINVYSKGKEIIVANSRIEIFNINNEKVGVFNPGAVLVEPTETGKIEGSLDVSSYPAGEYRAIAFVDYGGEKELRGEKEFRLGELIVDVVNYTKEFERIGITNFEIDIESRWNDPIENVYANVSILDHSINFITPSVNLDGFGKNKLVGYFDTTSIENDKFKARIVLNYEGKTTEKVVDLRFKKETNYLFIGLIAILALAIIFFVWVVIDYIRVRKKNGQKKKT